MRDNRQGRDSQKRKSKALNGETEAVTYFYGYKFNDFVSPASVWKAVIPQGLNALF